MEAWKFLLSTAFQSAFYIVCRSTLRFSWGQSRFGHPSPEKIGEREQKDGYIILMSSETAAKRGSCGRTAGVLDLEPGGLHGQSLTYCMSPGSHFSESWLIALGRKFIASFSFKRSCKSSLKLHACIPQVDRREGKDHWIIERGRKMWVESVPACHLRLFGGLSFEGTSFLVTKAALVLSVLVTRFFYDKGHSEFIPFWWFSWSHPATAQGRAWLCLSDIPHLIISFPRGRRVDVVWPWQGEQRSTYL